MHHFNGLKINTRNTVYSAHFHIKNITESQFNQKRRLSNRIFTKIIKIAKFRRIFCDLFNRIPEFSSSNLCYAMIMRRQMAVFASDGWLDGCLYTVIENFQLEFRFTLHSNESTHQSSIGCWCWFGVLHHFSHSLCVSVFFCLCVCVYLHEKRAH